MVEEVDRRAWQDKDFITVRHRRISDRIPVEVRSCGRLALVQKACGNVICVLFALGRVAGVFFESGVLVLSAANF